LVAVDNTTATAYLQQPLALGADYVVASDTKALTGRSDLVLGHVATASDERAAALRTWRTHHGAIPGPMEAWLAHRSLATLPLRLTRQCMTAMEVARHLRTSPEISAVYHPGLPDHPGHDIAARQMSAFGPVVSFDLGSRLRAVRVGECPSGCRRSASMDKGNVAEELSFITEHCSRPPVRACGDPKHRQRRRPAVHRACRSAPLSGLTRDRYRGDEVAHVDSTSRSATAAVGRRQARTGRSRS
jgi:hypothetical protein